MPKKVWWILLEIFFLARQVLKGGSQSSCSGLVWGKRKWYLFIKLLESSRHSQDAGIGRYASFKQEKAGITTTT